MSIKPFYFVTLTHSNWDEAVAFANGLPPEATVELRLDLFPNKDPKEMVIALNRRCLVSCRKFEDGGKWHGTEAERLKHLSRSIQGQPDWVDLEWNLSIPPVFDKYTNRTNLLRSVHVGNGVFDLEQRLHNLPKGDAFKWVGKATSLLDNLKLKKPLRLAKNLGLIVSAFLLGPKGIVSRCMQAAWGGSFTYAHPDNAQPIAPGQVALCNMMLWNCHNLHADYQLCGVIGHPVLHSLGPNYHNLRFQKLSNRTLYLPLECHDPIEARNAIESLGLIGVSITAPLKESLPAQLGLKGPMNTLWRKKHEKFWQGTNTDYLALDSILNGLAAGPVLVLGDGGVAKTTKQVVLHRGWPCLLYSRRNQIPLDFIYNFKPVGLVQATCLGMYCNDPMPFPDVIANTRSTIQWGVEWVYREDTAFAKWIRNHGCDLVPGIKLFALQASKQSDIFVGNSEGL